METSASGYLGGRMRNFVRFALSEKFRGLQNAGARRSLLWVVVVSGMVILLVVAAVLQFRWMQKLRAATELQIGSNLQSLMTSWHRDLYAEVSAICIALQVGPDSGAYDAWDDYLERYARWKQGGLSSEPSDGLYANPDLIRDIYIWQTSLPPAQLLRLDPNAKNVVPSAVPKEFGPLLTRLTRNSSDLRQAFHAWEGSQSLTQNNSRGTASATPARGGNGALAGWQFDSNVPAIVHPLLHHNPPFDDGAPVTHKAVDWLVVVLNRSTLQNRIFPELAARHFSSSDGLEYNLGVLANGPEPQALYSSDPGFTSSSDSHKFDSMMDVFGGPADETIAESNSSRDKKRAWPGRQWRNFVGPAWFPVIQYGSEKQSWYLVLQHRTSPVEAMATSLWRRDLIIGSVVLLLLAVNITLVGLAGVRAQKFAKLQMEFVASVSHELRTPLAAIFSAGENIRDGFVEGKESLKFYGSLVTSQARQLTELVDRILLFASIRDGKTKYVARPLMVSEILERVRKNTADLVERAGYKLEEQVDPGLPWVEGDLAAVCACLQNFISNAVKYGGVDHWIRITATPHETGRNAKEVRISVEDHGQGISDTELQQIFEPFYRSPRVLRAQIHGTGLGLALTKQIAESLGGRVSVSSKVGMGSTFTLHLRAVDTSTQENSLATVSESGIGN